jgi:hypothetical protein
MYNDKLILMKSHIALLLISIFIAIQASSQINLVGAILNQETGQIDILEWQALDPESLITHPSQIDGYYFGSSVFDAYNSNYYITGISGNITGLFDFNLILQQPVLTHQYALDVSQLSPGAYYLRIIHRGEAKATRIVMVQ